VKEPAEKPDAKETEFVRTEVKTDAPVEEGWFIAEGLEAEEEIVTEGAAALLTAETNTAAEEE
jgi:hypothetical protein